VRVNEKDIGLDQIEAGLAWGYRKYACSTLEMVLDVGRASRQRFHSAGNSFRPIFLSPLDKPISYKGYRVATAAALSLLRMDNPR